MRARLSYPFTRVNCFLKLFSPVQVAGTFPLDPLSLLSCPYTTILPSPLQELSSKNFNYFLSSIYPLYPLIYQFPTKNLLSKNPTIDPLSKNPTENIWDKISHYRNKLMNTKKPAKCYKLGITTSSRKTIYIFILLFIFILYMYLSVSLLYTYCFFRLALQEPSE
jgi:hypothetical protein